MTTHVIAPIDLPAFLAPTIAAALDEAESQAEIPRQLHSQLRDAGAFRLLTPREYGGSETPLTELLEVYERFGHIEASTGLLVWNANFGFIAALLSEPGAQRIWSSGAPRGRRLSPLRAYADRDRHRFRGLVYRGRRCDRER